MNQDAAETIALQALGFLASDPKLLEGLMANSGLDPQSLNTTGIDPGTLVGVLHFLLQDDDRTIAFCEAENLQTFMPGRAWSTLTGQDIG
jgi:hypothetical protein